MSAHQAAVDFLMLLDEEAEAFTFQTFDDNKARGDKALACVMHGAFHEIAPELERLNRAGAGVFVTVNETDGKGRKLQNLQRVRALWQEDDGQGKPLPLEPHIEVETSPGKFHRYLLVDGLGVDDFRAAMRAMVSDFGSDRNAADPVRVLRLPGFLHCKGNPHLVRIISATHAQPYSAERARTAFRVSGEQQNKQGRPDEILNAEVVADIESALKSLSSDPRDVWVQVAHALKHYEQGWRLWLAWSEKSSAFDAEDARRVWASIASNNGATYRTVFKLAADAGWTNPKSSKAPPPERGRVPSRADLICQAAEFKRAELTPKCFVESHTYADLAQLVAPGGTGKTTIILREAIDLCLGRPVWGCRTVTPGWTLIVTAEDERERLLARLREICAAMGLSAEDTLKVRESVLVWDVSGAQMRLVFAKDGNVVLTTLADEIIEAFKGDPPAVVLFDPLVSFGAAESLVNDNEQGLVTAARRIIRGLGCCVRYIHHTGKANAREKTLDQYTGRNGSSLPDGTRMTFVLQTWDADDKHQPPPDCTPSPDSSITILARPKLSYAPPNLPRIWLKRTGFHFEHFIEQPEDAERHATDRADRLHAFISREVAAGKFPTKTSLGESSGGIGMTRQAVRDALKHLLDSGRVCVMDLPAAEKKGARKDFLCPSHSADRFGGIGKQNGVEV